MSSILRTLTRGNRFNAVPTWQRRTADEVAALNPRRPCRSAGRKVKRLALAFEVGERRQITGTLLDRLRQPAAYAAPLPTSNPRGVFDTVKRALSRLFSPRGR